MILGFPGGKTTPRFLNDRPLYRRSAALQGVTIGPRIQLVHARLPAATWAGRPDRSGVVLVGRNVHHEADVQPVAAALVACVPNNDGRVMGEAPNILPQFCLLLRCPFGLVRL